VSDRQVEVPITIDSQLAGSWFPAASSHSKEEEEEDDDDDKEEEEEWIAVGCSIKEQDSCPLLQPEVLKKTVELKSPQVDLHNNYS